MQVLSQEKNENMASLVEEVDELRETNRVLQNTIDELMQRLEDQEASRCYHRAHLPLHSKHSLGSELLKLFEFLSASFLKEFLGQGVMSHWSPLRYRSSLTISGQIKKGCLLCCN